MKNLKPLLFFLISLQSFADVVIHQELMIKEIERKCSNFKNKNCQSLEDPKCCVLILSKIGGTKKHKTVIADLAISRHDFKIDSITISCPLDPSGELMHPVDCWNYRKGKMFLPDSCKEATAKKNKK